MTTESNVKWCVHCGEGVINVCRSRCENRECPSGLPKRAPTAAAEAAPVVPSMMAAFRLLVAACNRLDFESEEYDLPDGWGCGAQMEYWSEFRTALERAQESLSTPQAVEARTLIRPFKP